MHPENIQKIKDAANSGFYYPDPNTAIPGTFPVPSVYPSTTTNSVTFSSEAYERFVFDRLYTMLEELESMTDMSVFTQKDKNKLNKAAKKIEGILNAH